MTAHEITANDVVTLTDLKLLSGASGPCITIVTHISNPSELSVRLKNAVRSTERKLKELKKLKDRRTESAVIESGQRQADRRAANPKMSNQ